jgi:superfamily I DNA and RNA helicase
MLGKTMNLNSFDKQNVIYIDEDGSITLTDFPPEFIDLVLKFTKKE